LTRRHFRFTLGTVLLVVGDLALTLLDLSELVGDVGVNGETLDWDVSLWEHVKHVELEGHRAFLSDGKDLEPAKALCGFNHLDQVVPLFT